MKSPIALAIHGGAGVLKPGRLSEREENDIHAWLHRAITTGHRILEAGGNCLDAVEACVVELELCPWFNAGLGAVFTQAGEHELDAAIMRGSDRNAGAIAGARHVRHPICGARQVMEHSDHVMLGGRGADDFLESRGMTPVDNDYFDTPLRQQQWEEHRHSNGATALEPTHTEGHKFGTVGAVALDSHGHVAAATSTGGITNKRYGRIGDTPLIGAGTWADDRSAAISATGHGEYFIRTAVAHDIAARMQHGGADLATACDDVVHGELKAIGGDGGVIAVAPDGDTRLVFNTPGMYRAWRDENGVLHTAIYADDDRQYL
ncbi:isoaspartyl peptidase/L-asparaginase family protein [Salinicola tamaricis]|uniref:isoaspartyl peptidase/L-asparaginase family protein n=1 Tax=Salinicola tamaricis TaxID=1771309 RepID=UPI000D0A4FD7|nr:isoaspartyl peptidase/L-asparaginase [Salinicola tamaricis]